MSAIEEQLARVDPSQRVLLLSHCLRPSQTCPGKYSKQGLECPPDCNEDCSNGRLRRLAVKLGYKGVCIAPGGRLALKFVKENSPQGIVAIACHKELEEGIQGVKELAAEAAPNPAIVVVPLTKDGCVDTEVNEELALEMVALGCTLPSGEGRA
ncbi:MAG: DUF116 domain-containing protein [Chloroflexi bacterium]|nr:DUF116 domain-containing protein [Chloroflexota bacterium]